MDKTFGEDKFCDLFKQKGYQLTKKGYPDFLVFKDDGKTFSFVMAEIKRDPDTLSPSQRRMIALLRYYGVPVSVIYNGVGVDELDFTDIDSKKLNKIYKSLFRNKNAIFKKEEK